MPEVAGEQGFPSTRSPLGLPWPCFRLLSTPTLKALSPEDVPRHLPQQDPAHPMLTTWSPAMTGPSSPNVIHVVTWHDWTQLTQC